MGFTRYWRRPKELDATKFADFSSDCKKTCADLQIPVVNSVFDESIVRFDGDPGCEPFVVERISPGREIDNLVTEFCKTQLLPYDKTVETCIFNLKAHFPDVDVPRPS